MIRIRNILLPAVLVLISTTITTTVRSAESTVPFREDWALPTSDSFTLYGDHGTPESGIEDSIAQDGRSIRLRLNANPPAGVGGAPGAETKDRYLYGSYWSRVRTADCSSQPNAGVVTGIFTYFNDGSDSNGNGVPDNSELDFEWLCAKPEVLHLSIWTDYLEAEVPQIRVTYRSINIKTGQILQECFRTEFGECQELSSAERQPTNVAAIPDYDPANKYYDYGVILEANRIQFLMILDGVTRVLWDYQGPSERIPKQHMHFMHNVWHTNNWFPIDNPGTAIESPNSQVNIFVDYSSFTPI